ASDLNGGTLVTVPAAVTAPATGSAAQSAPLSQGQSATIKIADGSGGPVPGDELFIYGQQSGTVDNGAVTVSWNDSTKVLTLTGNASTAVYQSLLGAVTYQDTGVDTSIGSHPQRTVTWIV